MQLFHLKGPNKMVSAAHKWQLPFAKCPQCGQGWNNLELAYPNIGLPEGSKPKDYKAVWVAWEKYQQLRDPIRRAVGDQWPTPTGTNFGPLEGDMIGPFTDFAWVWDWQCLVRKDVLDRLNEALGSKLEAAQAFIRTRRKGKQPDYWELVAWPTARLADETKALAKRFDCPCCGPHYSFKDKPVRIQPTVPKGSHILRVLEGSRWILCTETFRRAVEELKLQNISFVPVET